MTRPIDIECPTCKVTAGRYCVDARFPDFTAASHHAERVDAAMAQVTQPQQVARDAPERPRRLMTLQDWLAFEPTIKWTEASHAAFRLTKQLDTIGFCPPELRNESLKEMARLVETIAKSLRLGEDSDRRSSAPTVEGADEDQLRAGLRTEIAALEQIVSDWAALETEPGSMAKVIEEHIAELRKLVKP